MSTSARDSGVAENEVRRPIARRLSGLNRDEMEATSSNDFGNGRPGVVPATRRIESGREQIAAMSPSVEGGHSLSFLISVPSKGDSTTTESGADSVDGASGAYHDERKEQITSVALAQNAQDPVSRPAVTGDGKRSQSSRSSSSSSDVVPGLSKKSIPPLSPPSRNRGYSFCRSLFSRALHDKVTPPGSAIELELARAPHPPSTISSDDRKEKAERVPMAAIATMSRQGVDSVGKSNDFPERRKLANLQRSWEATMGSQCWPQLRLARAFEFLRAKVWKVKESPLTGDGRHIDLDIMCRDHIDGRAAKEYVDNTITSSRYTLWNFIPRQLFAQFSKLANFYFLCVSVLQMIPTLSTTGKFATIVPLTFFVTLSMAKEGYDDLRRYRLDRAENNSDASVLMSFERQDADSPAASTPLPASAERWIRKQWSDIRVGDIIRLKRNESVPADIILLSVDQVNGIAYIETIALDGETNLKSKQTVPILGKLCSTIEGMMRCNAHLVVENPNLDLYNFEGRVTVDGQTEPLTSSAVIYRGSVLRNTKKAIGMAIYTGEECKIRMNATKNARIKAPSLQSRVNQVVMIIIVFVIVLAVFNTAAYRFWYRHTERNSWYLIHARVPSFPILASFIILFNTMIPLSLYVSLEIIKLGQLYNMDDVDMYDSISNTPMEARTSTINEELGQVSYIFSDKTGTLTENSMRFRKLSVAGTAWIHGMDLNREAEERPIGELHRHQNREGKTLARPQITGVAARTDSRGSAPSASAPGPSVDPESARQRTLPRVSSARQTESQTESTTQDLLRFVQRNPQTPLAQKVRFFMLAIALCHTCLPEVTSSGVITFQAASPDELALVKAAQDLGFMVIDREMGTITLRIVALDSEQEPVSETYQTLDVIEFSSQRKRMSIIVRFPNQQICLITKGADSTMTKLLKLAKLAALKASDVQREAEIRKGLEAKQVIYRNSLQLETRGSGPRASITLNRISIGGLNRRSTSGAQIQPIRDEIDAWLKHREHEHDVDSVKAPSIYGTPRTSMNKESRKSHDARLSMASAYSRTPRYAHLNDSLGDGNLLVDEGTIFERCFQHINDFATEGLRTLVYASRFLDEQEYSSWKRIYLEATTSLKNRSALIEEAGDLVERDLELIGATAIEDKLQAGVPEAIDKLRRANIKIWMLTGDKRETAINIGHSCRLIKDYSSVTILDHEKGALEPSLDGAMRALRAGQVAHSVVVIDGQTLAVVEEDADLRSRFFDLMITVDSVICCRASPSQKASLVRAIRKCIDKSVTLAIGDGANDIAMIQEAHVGIGITGKEGLQAARISDYSIAQFRFLLKLLLVHGRWNYIRTCKYTLATFYKEFLFYLTQALFQRYVGFTGVSLYEEWSLTFFNTLFTSLPVILPGMFEKDLRASTLLAVPELYNKGQRSAAFNIRVYLGWTFMASSEAMIIFFTMVGIYGFGSHSRTTDLYAMGTLTFTAIVTVISTKLLILEMHSKSWIAMMGFVVSVGGWFIFNVILSLLYKKNTIYNVRGGIIDRFGEDPSWWLTLISVILMCVVFEVGITALRSAWFPTDVDLFQEYEQDLGLRLRFEESASTELQQGWDRTSTTSGSELTREEEIEYFLNRPRVMEEGWIPPSSNALSGPGRPGAG